MPSFSAKSTNASSKIFIGGLTTPAPTWPKPLSCDTIGIFLIVAEMSEKVSAEVPSDEVRDPGVTDDRFAYLRHNLTIVHSLQPNNSSPAHVTEKEALRKLFHTS